MGSQRVWFASVSSTKVSQHDAEQSLGTYWWFDFPQPCAISALHSFQGMSLHAINGSAVWLEKFVFQDGQIQLQGTECCFPFCLIFVSKVKNLLLFMWESFCLAAFACINKWWSRPKYFVLICLSLIGISLCLVNCSYRSETQRHRHYTIIWKHCSFILNLLIIASF